MASAGEAGSSPTPGAMRSPPASTRTPLSRQPSGTGAARGLPRGILTEGTSSSAPSPGDGASPSSPRQHLNARMPMPHSRQNAAGS